MKSVLKKYKNGVAVVGLILVASAVACALYSYHTFNNIKDNVVRLHVVANSDSKEDQELKLLVRDKVIECVESMDLNSKNAEEYLESVNDNSEIIEETVEAYLAELGSSYSASVSVGESAFPAKNYGDVVLPAGNYNAVNVTIGEGEGKNWWCVMFPPLCCTNSGTVAVSNEGKELLRENLSAEAYKTVIGEAADTGDVSLIADDGLVSDNVTVNVRFKIVEVVMRIFNID